MWIFLAAILLVYALLHVYIFRRIRAAFPRRLRLHDVLRGFFFLMPVAPFVIHAVDTAGFPWAARVLGWIGYPWIALIFWSSGVLMAADVWNLAARGAAQAWPRARRAAIPPKSAVISAAILVTLVSAWSLVEANALRSHEVWIQTAWLAPGAPPLRIVQISDMHLSVERGPGVLRRVEKRIRELKPDLLVSTGDLVDSTFKDIEALAEPLRNIRPPLGKFAVLGNHEYYSRLRNSLPFHEAAGFRLLRQESVAVTPSLRLSGVDDPAGLHTGQPCFPDETKVLTRGDAGAFTILLKHQPLVLPDSIGRFDLQLSGHLHGGQLFPFNVVLRLLYPFGRGMYRLGDRSLLYVSRGAGTWGPPMRFLAPPEICLLVLQPAGP
ncbi:MAG: metallophosphoesterase [Verrucomicrobiota bacterium]